MRLPSILPAAALVLLAGAGLVACEHTQPAAAPPAPMPPATTLPVSPPVAVAPPDAPPSAVPLAMALLVDPPSMADPPPIAEQRQRIVGRENERADAVFQNVTVLGNLSASELLTTMVAFNEAMGTRCSFCHAQGGDWASDANRHKAIARGMIRMTHRINTADLVLAGADDGSRITCYTCHGGRTRPQLSPADTVRRRPPGGRNG